MPFGDVPIQPTRDIALKLSDKDRQKIAPGLEDIVSGITTVKVSSKGGEGDMAIDADLSAAELSLPWIGWTKGAGVKAKSVFDLVLADKETRISNFSLDGGSFSAKGDITVSQSGLQSAHFGKVRLNQTDDISVSVERKGKGYSIAVKGSKFDARALIRHVRKQMSSPDAGDGVPVDLTADVGSVAGFGDEALSKVKVTMHYDGRDVTELTISATSASGFPVNFHLEGAGAKRTLQLEALDGGEILRFLDIYGQVRGGVLTLNMTGSGDDRLTGKADLNDFRIFNEPRLNALVSSKAPDSHSLNDVIKSGIDTSEVKFDRASATLAVTPASLQVANAIVRGAVVGATFQGTVYDKNNNMRMTGTFMPAYGLNRLLADIPLIGALLGNGRDRGLIGITFRLDGRRQEAEAQRQSAVGDRAGHVPLDLRVPLELASGGPHEHVLLLAERQLDDAVAGRFAASSDRALVGDRLVVDAHRAALDVPPRLAVGGGKAGLHEQRQHADAGSSSAAGTSMVGRVSASAPSSKVLRAVSAASSAASRPCSRAVTSVASTFLASLISAPPSSASRRDLVHRQRREELQEAGDVGVLGVAPVLPEVIGAEQVRVEPDRALGRLAHLGARRGGQQRRGQRVELLRAHAVAEVDAVDDIAPLVGAAHLQIAAVAARQFDVVVGLADHVVEFEEGHRLLAVEPQLDRIEGQHAVDREMPADIAQELDVAELRAASRHC